MPVRKILVIDDSRVIRRCVKDMLPSGEFEVIEAEDGAEGWELIRTTNPNLIMLDFFLPKMSGWDVYQEIQKEQSLKAIPLVMMSGRKEEVTEKIPEPFKDFAFVEKPFDQKQLIDGIRDAMQKAKKHALQPTPVTTPTSLNSEEEIARLKAAMVKMNAEINSLKKQMNQLVQFIKRKLS